MIQFTDFYDDINFVAAVFYNNLLDSLYIYEIANHLTNKISDDNLAKIIVTGGEDDNNKKLFENYLKKLKIRFLDPKRALTAKIFYYILNDKIDFKEGIEFVHYNISEPKGAVGDDIGIDRMLSKYYAIDDNLVPNKKDIKIFKQLILEEMRQYIKDNLVEFPVGNVKKNSGNTKAELKKSDNMILAKDASKKMDWEDYEKSDDFNDE